MNAEHASSNDASTRFDGVDETNLALLPPAARPPRLAPSGATACTMGGEPSSAQLLPTLMTMDPKRPAKRHAVRLSLRCHRHKKVALAVPHERSMWRCPSWTARTATTTTSTSRWVPSCSCCSSARSSRTCSRSSTPNTDDEGDQVGALQADPVQNFPTTCLAWGLPGTRAMRTRSRPLWAGRARSRTFCRKCATPTWPSRAERRRRSWSPAPRGGDGICAPGRGRSR